MQDAKNYLIAAAAEFSKTVKAFDRDWGYNFDVSPFLSEDAAEYKSIRDKMASIRKACFSDYWSVILERDEVSLESVRASMLGHEVDALRHDFKSLWLSEYLIGASGFGQRLVHARAAAACLTSLCKNVERVGFKESSTVMDIKPISVKEFEPFIALRHWLSCDSLCSDSQLFLRVGFLTLIRLLILWSICECVLTCLQDTHFPEVQADRNLVAVGSLVFMPKAGADFTALSRGLGNAEHRPEDNVSLDPTDTQGLKSHLSAFGESAAAVFRALTQEDSDDSKELLEKLSHQALVLSMLQRTE